MVTSDCISQQKNQKVDKGYYSIGTNSNMLAKVDDTNVIRQQYVADPYSQSPKGYYSPEINRRKLPWRNETEQTRGSLIPFVTKGYYAIGRNALRSKK
jgi:hypothetical protein